VKTPIFPKNPPNFTSDKQNGRNNGEIRKNTANKKTVRNETVPHTPPETVNGWPQEDR